MRFSGVFSRVRKVLCAELELFYVYPRYYNNNINNIVILSRASNNTLYFHPQATLEQIAGVGCCLIMHVLQPAIPDTLVRIPKPNLCVPIVLGYPLVPLELFADKVLLSSNTLLALAPHPHSPTDTEPTIP